MKILATYENSRITSKHFLDDFDTALTKKEMQERLQELHRQKEQYERENRIFMSEERKKALSE